MFKSKKQTTGRSRSNVKSTLKQPANFSSRKIDNSVLEPDKPAPKKTSLLKTVTQKFGLLILLVVGLVSLANILTLSANPTVAYLRTDGQTGHRRCVGWRRKP